MDFRKRPATLKRIFIAAFHPSSYYLGALIEPSIYKLSLSVI